MAGLKDNTRHENDQTAARQGALGAAPSSLDF
jgi:hypothetical protein